MNCFEMETATAIVMIHFLTIHMSLIQMPQNDTLDVLYMIQYIICPRLCSKKNNKEPKGSKL